MEVVFRDTALEDLYTTGATDSRKYKKLARNRKLIEGYQRAVDAMYAVHMAADLASFSFLHYERLKHRHESSVRILNGSIERLLFTETNEGIEVELIEIDSTHYGNKK